MNDFMFQNNSLILKDIENNTFVEIIKDCYSARNGVPEFQIIWDDCLELMTDNCISTVTYKGIRMSRHNALDILEDILQMEGFVYRRDRIYINPFQLQMFDEDLYE